MIKKFGVITLMPQFFEVLMSQDKMGLIGKAFACGKAELFVEDLRDSGEGVHKTVDDTPYGGGDGMVLKPEPIKVSLEKLLKKMNLDRSKTKVIYTCPAGELWTQKKAETFVADDEQLEGVVFFCGRYAGADVRAVRHLFDESFSIGPFVLNGGEIPALCMIESLVRLTPGVLGNKESTLNDSFSEGLGGVEASSYTKPRIWEGLEVPEVLLSGDHGRIKAYRNQESSIKTKKWVERAKESIKASLGPIDLD